MPFYLNIGSRNKNQSLNSLQKLERYREIKKKFFTEKLYDLMKLRTTWDLVLIICIYICKYMYIYIYSRRLLYRKDLFVVKKKADCYTTTVNLNFEDH